jgi:monoamine oxidase
MTLEKVKEYAKKVPNMIPEQVIVRKAPVTAIRASDPQDQRSPLIVTAGGREYTYSHVISTVPLPNFACIDTSTLKMSVMQQNAIRQLQYGPSIKVGILFKTAWWKEEPYNQKPGGQSFTDLPIRTIVYPSYGPDQSSRVLIASYCWTNDAERLGNIIDNNVDGILLDLMLRNLATVHQADVDELKKQYVNHFAWNWNHDAWTGGE